MEPVGVGRRAVAVLVDSILLFAVGYVIAAASGQTTEAGFEIRGAPFFLWLAISLAYFIVQEALQGTTLGKRVMRLKVVKQDGSPMDWQASIARNVLRLIDGLFFYLLGAIVIWVSKQKQRLGDIAAKTIVVSARSWMPLLLAGILGAGASFQTLAAAPHYSGLVMSDERGGKARHTFTPDTPKIYLRAHVEMPSGTVVKGRWVAVHTRVAPPNYRIDETELRITSLMDEVTFSMSKPNKGWPAGDYRVELFIDGKHVRDVPFRVK